MEIVSVSTPEPDTADASRTSKRPFLIVGLVVLTGIVALVAYVIRTRGLESTDDDERTLARWLDVRCGGLDRHVRK